MGSKIRIKINALLYSAVGSAAVAWIIVFVGVLLEEPRNSLPAATLFALVVLVGAIPVALTAGSLLAVLLARVNMTHPAVFSAVGAVLAMAGASLLVWVLTEDPPLREGLLLSATSGAGGGLTYWWRMFGRTDSAPRARHGGLK